MAEAADTSLNAAQGEEPPYKKNLERLAALQERLSKVQKTAESLLATVSGSGGEYADKLIYSDYNRVKKFIESSPANIQPGLSLDEENTVEIRFVVKFDDADAVTSSLNKLKISNDSS
eukprot:767658-Hanusia_phi.AAC.4